ncbi:unnamed protein product [Pedinophyceae sp. YPF-701]|nr:unnamed protein product [Pedinophyceae sp. YPF-701]
MVASLRQPAASGAAFTAVRPLRRSTPRCTASPKPPALQRARVRAGGSSEAAVPALKEWNVAVEALSDPEIAQTVLMRKGGIREPSFVPVSRRFALVPTTFHTDDGLLQPRARGRYPGAGDTPADGGRPESFRLRCIAALTGAWTTTDPRVLSATNNFHVWSDAFLDTRLKWRPGKPITVLELRAMLLDPEIVVPAREEHFGCFSWVDFADTAPSLDDLFALGKPVLSDEAFAARQAELREELGRLEGVTDVLASVPDTCDGVAGAGAGP